MKQQIKNWLVRKYLDRAGVHFASLPDFGGRPWPKFERRDNGRIVLGEKCLFLTQRIRTILMATQEGSIQLGRECFLNDGVHIRAECRVAIGDYCGLSHMVTIYDTNSHPVDAGEEPLRAPVIIGRNVWISQRVMIMPGSTIGDHSVIGAYSVVWGDIPPRVVAVGFPARPVKAIKCPDDWIRLQHPGLA